MVGYNDSYIEDSYAEGNVKAEGIYREGSDAFFADTGGLVGRSTEIKNTINSYWDINTSGYENSAGGKGRTTKQMKSGKANNQVNGDSIYEGWSDNIWNFGADDEYPKFNWE